MLVLLSDEVSSNGVQRQESLFRGQGAPDPSAFLAIVADDGRGRRDADSSEGIAELFAASRAGLVTEEGLQDWWVPNDRAKDLLDGGVVRLGQSAPDDFDRSLSFSGSHISPPRGCHSSLSGLTYVGLMSPLCPTVSNSVQLCPILPYARSRSRYIMNTLQV